MIQAQKSNGSALRTPSVDFGPIAESYDRLYFDSTYPTQTDLILNRLLLPNLMKNARILDLCCGTGQLDAMLSKLGFRITGVDCSREMLRCARKNSPTSTYICADARRFRLPHACDAAISLSDSIHTIVDSSDLPLVFHNTRTSLKEDGFLVFDMTTEFGYENCRRESLTLVRSDAVLVHRFQFDPGARLGTTRVTTFHLECDEWKRSDSTLYERAYSVEELRGALLAGGFRRIEVFDAPTSDGEIGKVIIRAWKT